MCSRHQPTEGADSEEVDPRPPLIDLPVANRSMVEEYVRNAMPNASPQQIASQVSEVVMADSLGRAIHQAKRIGGPWPAPCARPKQWNREPKSDEDMEEVPYGYDSGEQECICESMALHLVELMKSQAALNDIIQNHTIVAPAAGNGRLS